MKVGVIGCGTIGTAVIKQVLSKKREKISSVFIYDLDESKVKLLREKFNWLKKSKSLKDIISQSNFLIEAASISCVQEVIPLIMKYKKDILVMSTGGLLKRKEMLEKAQKKNIEIIIPGGAIGGLDALRAVKNYGIKNLVLSTYKPLKVLENSPYVKKKNINLKNIRKENLIFEGNVNEAIKGFPQSINVSATLLLNSDFKNMKVKIFASRKRVNITHIIEVKSKFSNFKFSFENYPSPDNPKTSALAVYSACWEVEKYLDRHI